MEATHPTDRTAVISTAGLTKVFPPAVVALDDVSIAFAPGEIHAVVGENGAGKSTLMNVLYGLHEPERGSFHIHGHEVHNQTPARAIALGVGMVHQEIELVEEFSVWENVTLGCEPVSSILGTLDSDAARRQVAHKIAEFGLDLHADALVGELSVAARQKVEILKLLYRDVSVLILDEPTAVLTPVESERLFLELRRLRDGGRTILFVSHHLDEVIRLADRISVMRKGRLVDTVASAATDRATLASMMVGREVLFTQQRVPRPAGDAMLVCAGLAAPGVHGGRGLLGVDLVVRTGEIVAIAGVEGNGQRELVETIVGQRVAATGSVSIAEQPIDALSILDRRRLLAYVSEDRGRSGGSRLDSILDNARMTHHRLNPALRRRFGLLDSAAAERFTDEIRADYQVVMDDSAAPFASLSGGNQQKVILGRELSLDAPFVLLDQPTRGLDVGSIEYVHRTILAARSAGRAVLLVSSDLDEVLLLADRIVVLYRGRITAELDAASATRHRIGQAMVGSSDG